MDEAIQLAVSVCPLVIIDVVDPDTIRFDFQAAGLAREFANELAIREGDLRIVRLDREVIVRAI